MSGDAIRQRWLQPGTWEVLKSALAGLVVATLGVLVYLAYRNYEGRQRNEGDVTGETTDPPAPRHESSNAPGEQHGIPGSTPGKASGAETTLAGAGAPVNGLTAPATDTIAPNPPNGMAFGGSGHFQLYRQGDITWRLNTESGQACILFASDAEWRQPRVRHSACNRVQR